MYAKKKFFSLFTALVMIFAMVGIMPQMKVGALSMTYTPTNGFRNSKYYSQLCSVNLTSDQRANLVNVAKSQIGYHEGNNFEQYGGGSSGSGNVAEYNYWYYGQKHVSGVNYPWCAVFVSWCVKQAGLSNIIPSFAGCGTGYNSTLPGAGAKTYLRSTGYIPQSGDIIFFNSGGYSPGHVGIVNYVSNGYVYTIEGNSSDKVNTLSYSLSNTKIYGYAVPNYSGSKKWYDNYSPIDLGTCFCATVSNSTTRGYIKNEGWNVSAYPGNDQKNQAWIFNKQSDGSYTITSMLDTARLTTCNRDSSSGVSIVVSHDGVDLSQKWYIYNGNNGYMLRPLHSDKVMDLDGGGYAAGTNIQLYEYNNTSSQYYNINKIDWRDRISPSDIGNDFCAYIYNNTTGGYLDNEGWNVAAYPGHGGISQTFYFKKQDDGSYIISSLLDNARLTTCDRELNNKSSIVVTHDEINPLQKWYIYETNRGYIFRPAQSDKVMDLDGGGYAAGTNIQLYEYNSTFPQYYGIEKVEHNHSYGSWKTTKSPTCTSDGIKTRECSVCGEKETEAISKTGHKYSSKVIEPTYKEEGYTLHTCSNCGHTYKDNYVAMKKKGDLNADGKLSIADAVKLKSWLTSAPNSKLENQEAADLNSDGKINVFDLCILKRMLIKK